MPDFCAAVGCSNERNADTRQQGITFHRFPKDQVKRKAWTGALRRRDFEPKNCSVVCSCHFKSEDFDRTGQTTRLKEGVVPSILIFPDHLCKVPSSTSRFSRMSQKSAAENPDSLDQPSEELEEPTPDHQYAHDPVKEVATEAQEKVVELQRDLKNAMDRERRHRRTVKCLLQDLKHKDLLTEELQQKFDFYSGSTNKPRGRINKATSSTKLHITVQQHGVLPPLQKCVQCCNKYHCPFCTPDTFKPTKHSGCKKHLLSHKSRAVHHKGYDIYKCNLPCVPNAHFHCVYCTLTYSRRDGIIYHLTKCPSERSLDEPVLDEPMDKPVDKSSLNEPVWNEPIDESDLDEPMDKPSSEEPTSKEKVRCPQCSLTVKAKNLKNHLQRKHSENKIMGITPTSCKRSEPMDSTNPDILKQARWTEPVLHTEGVVTIDLDSWKRDQTIHPAKGDQSLDDPEDAPVWNEPASDESVDKPSSKEPTSKEKLSQVRGSKVNSVCCPQCDLTLKAKNLKNHLKRKHSKNNNGGIISTTTSCKRSESLDGTNPDILKRVRWTEPVLHTEGVVTIDVDSWKIDQTIHPPKGETDLDEPDDEPMDVPVWNELVSDESVDKPSLEEPISKETVSQARGSKVKSVRCPQCGLSMNAKNVKKHLQRKHSRSNIMDITPTSYKRSEPLDSTDPDIFKRVRWTEAALHTEDVVTTALAAVIYPPKGDLMKRMVEYTFNHKKLPATLPEEFRRITDYPKSLIPPENLCSVCPGAGPLTDPILITSKAKIVTADGIIEDISTYCKMCCKCGMFYRYQQFEDGLHNFNDSILLGLHFCLFLRANLQNNQSIGSLIQTLEYLTEMQFPSAESIRHGYLHFEALSNHVYSYNCVRCGDHPPVVILDLHKKGVFNMSETDLKAPPESYKGEVHIEDFWDSVTKHMIARGFLISNDENPFKVPPSFESWAPWIGPKTRKSSVVLNTEFQKLHAAPDEEAELHVTENHLVDELVNQEVEVARMLCKECGLDTTGSILDLVLRLKDGMRSRATYNKVFEKIWGASGGWAAVLCPCGIVYSVKVLLKGESPQDFADLLLSWQHIPNVCVYDSARGLARHTNSREPERILFSPHEGQLLYPTPEIIRDAKDGRINVNLPWLSKRKNPPDVDCHPCTGSSEHYVLSNVHERTSSDSKDVLRRVSLVPQLATLLNTQVVEQFFDHMRKADYFQNDTASESYMFLLRNVLHHRNMRLNKETATLISKHTLEEKQPSAVSQTNLMCGYRFITL